MSDLILPLLMLAVCSVGLFRRENVYALLTDGAADGLSTLVKIAPPLIVLLAAVRAFGTSGAAGWLTDAAAPLFRLFGIPPELAPLVLLRPFSGSAALAVGADLMKTYGVHSQIGRTAAVMLGSTETTFYTISVYFGAAGIRRTRYAAFAALIADLTGFLASAWCVRLFWGN